MGSRRRSLSRLGSSFEEVTSRVKLTQSSHASDFLRNSEASVSLGGCKGVQLPLSGREDLWREEGLFRGRMEDQAKCTSSKKSHNSRNYFSIANGLILTLILLLCWTTCHVHGGFPGRGPPSPPRGPPLLPHHPLSGMRFNRRRPPPPRHLHHHHGPPSRGRHPHHHVPHPTSDKGHHQGGGDLSVAAQTLYDLRGYQFPSGPENPRFHRQNDPFTLPTPSASNPRVNGAHGHVSQDTRTAPLVFPSFYQEQPTPTPTRATIFGHNQHLSQTRFEPPAGFHLGGNSASSKITLEQQSASSRDQFRPSQIDISLHSNQVTPSPTPFGPQAQTSTLTPEKKSLTSTGRSRAIVKLNKSQQQDPFVYVYDEVDYDEGDDDFVLGGRQRTPQGQINNNRITPSTSTTTVAPLRAREPTIVPTPNHFPTLQYHQPQQPHHHHQALYTSTTTKQPATTQNSLLYSPQQDDFRNHYHDPTGIIRPPVTPRPNVEIVPSSERKPPPDQSNAISPALNRFPQSTIRDFNRPQQQLSAVQDVIDLRRRPTGTTTTTVTPPHANAVEPQFQREAIFPHLQQYQQPQGRQVSPSPSPTPIPYFPPGLDRRPFETTNDIPSIQTKNQFDQVVNLLQEEEEEYNQNQGAAPNLVEQGFNNPSKLRPVNTLIPKNRIPKEDIVLPPNFLFTHGLDITTPLSPTAPERGRGETTQQRLRDQTTRIREELPRTRPPARLQEEDDDDNIINQHHSQVSPPPAPPSRARGRQPTQRTTPPPLGDAPPRTRTNSPRQRLRQNYRPTTTTSTTPVPTYVEYPSQEYLDEYDNQQYQQSPSPPAQVLSPVIPQQQKPQSRFPPFPGKKTEVSTVAPTPLQRQRPTLAGRQRPGKGNRFRETATQDAGTSPRTTGKPLYTTGKMLSKEGGLYAGQMITSSHVYGQPIPNIPINSVLDKMPGVLDGKSVIFATSKPSFGSPQKQLRSKQRFQEHGPPSRVTSSSHRFRPTARPSHESSLDIVETVTLRPYSSELDKSKEEPKRLRSGSQFIRGSHQQASTERGQGDGQSVLPRRRKRPGHRHPFQQHHPDPHTETVSIQSSARPSENKDTSSFQTERSQILRESPALETTTANNVTPRSRRPRPRPGKLNQSTEASNASERSREREEDSQSRANDDEPSKPLKPARKLRPRLRTVPVGQLNAQQQRGSPSEVIPQSQSAQVDRKPTDAPGRFSSRFREQDNFDSTTVSSLRGDDRETGSSTPSRFSPPPSRLTFKPPMPKKISPRKRPQQQNSREDDGDSLPDSIKLSPKDVIANRKPARRIPPGSASDRLKALQQRRNKGFTQHEGDGEQTAEGRQVPVTKRPRLKPILLGQKQEDNLPQPQRLRRPNPTAPELTGTKREIFSNVRQRENKLKHDVDYYDEDTEQNKEDFEEENDEYGNEEEAVTPPSPQSHLIASVTGKPGRNKGGFHRNKSVEVTSDEARSVLGIPRPASPNRSPMAKRLRFQKKFQHEDEEVEEDGYNEEQLLQDSRPRLQANPVRLKLRPNSNSDHSQVEEDERTPSREIQTVLPERQKVRSGQVSRERPSRERPHREEEQEEAQEDYRDADDDVEESEPPRKPYQKHSQRYHSSPSSFQKVFRNKKLNTHAGQTGGNRQQQQVVEEEEPEENEEIQEEQEDDITPSSERSTTTTSSSSTSTSSTSTSTSSSSTPHPSADEQEAPLALSMRAGPQPIKQSLLKTRLRPNRRLNGNRPKQQQQTEVSISVTTTEATFPEERKQSGPRRIVSKVLRPRPHSGGGGGKRNSKKFIAMATENPSLPLESIFPEV